MKHDIQSTLLIECVGRPITDPFYKAVFKKIQSSGLEYQVFHMEDKNPINDPNGSFTLNISEGGFSIEIEHGNVQYVTFYAVDQKSIRVIKFPNCLPVQSDNISVEELARKPLYYKNDFQSVVAFNRNYIIAFKWFEVEDQEVIVSITYACKRLFKDPLTIPKRYSFSTYAIYEMLEKIKKKEGLYSILMTEDDNYTPAFGRQKDKYSTIEI